MLHAGIDIFCYLQKSIVQEFFFKFMFGIFRVFGRRFFPDESNLADWVKKRLNNTINSIIVVLGFWIVVDSEQTFTKLLPVTSRKTCARGQVGIREPTPQFHNKNNSLSLKTRSNTSGFFVLYSLMRQYVNYVLKLLLHKISTYSKIYLQNPKTNVVSRKFDRMFFDSPKLQTGEKRRDETNIRYY